MNNSDELIELLLADELNLEDVRSNPFFQEVKKALVVKFGERGLTLRLRDSILYNMLDFRKKRYTTGDTSKETLSALEELIRQEARLVGEGHVDRIFNEFRRAIAQKFGDLDHVEWAIRRIEALKGGGNSSRDKKRQPAKKRRKQACPATTP